MRAIDRIVVIGFLIVMRRQRDGQDGYASVEAGAHEPVHHGLRHEIMPALEKIGDGLGLHRGGFPDAQFIEAFDEVGGYAQGFKIAHKARV